MWTVVGASVAGRGKAAVGGACQDASDWLVESNLACLVVADGAGSRPMSAHGSRLAVECVLRQAAVLGETTGVDPADWLPRVVDQVRRCLVRSAADNGDQVGDYATTLAVAVLAGEVLGVAQVGDTIAVAGEAGRYRTLAPAPRFEYVNETVFVTDPGAIDQLRLTTLPADEVDAVFLSTDGLRLKIIDDLAVGNPFVPFFDDVAAYVRSPGANSDAVHRFLTEVDDQSGDDKSLVVAVRRQGTGAV
ncbi:PP2C family serine/threonine-protein phosphatase [Micromonospora sp. NPDC050187]|uniref:PP2C family serine/threonine-protein phosphatase n=1 Tax=Micromonospora sp. NPDC050187 TaxID=3364277 RepID=UPI0037A688B8